MFFSDIFVYLIWAIPSILMLLMLISSIFNSKFDRNFTKLNAQNFIFALTAFSFCFVFDFLLSSYLKEVLVSFDPGLFQLVRVFYLVPAFLVASIILGLFR